MCRASSQHCSRKSLSTTDNQSDFNLFDFWLFSKLTNARVNDDFECVEELNDFLRATLTSIKKDAFYAQVEKFIANLIAVINDGGNYV